MHYHSIFAFLALATLPALSKDNPYYFNRRPFYMNQGAQGFEFEANFWIPFDFIDGNGDDDEDEWEPSYEGDEQDPPAPAHPFHPVPIPDQAVFAAREPADAAGELSDEDINPRPRQRRVIVHTTPLIQAVEFDEVGQVAQLLEEGVDVNETNELGATALHAAAIVGNLEVIRILLAAGADPNRQSEANGETPIERARLYGHLECANEMENSQ